MEGTDHSEPQDESPEDVAPSCLSLVAQAALTMLVMAMAVRLLFRIVGAFPGP